MVVGLVAIGLLAACAQQPVPQGAAPTSAVPEVVDTPSSAPAGTVVVDFDGLELGPHGIYEGALVPAGEARAVVRMAGPVSPVTDTVAGAAEDAVAVQFPPACAESAECSKLIVEVPGSAVPAAGEGYSFGATVRLEPDQTAKGSNVVQRGFSTGRGGVWKLQVDGTEGKPSCVVVAVGAAEIQTLVGDRSVADGQWHQITCSREGAVLTITVDGEVAGTMDVGDLVIAPEGPVRIGGKSLKPDNDQFHGAVDEVFFGAV